MTFNILNYKEILDYIGEKSLKSVKLVVVSKNHTISAVEEAILAGARIFGENRVQEAKDKFFNLKEKFKDIELHLTGPLQTNKVKNALSIFDVIQTLDREKLANELAKNSNLIKNKSFFVQVNTGKENSKSGIFPEDADEFINYCLLDLDINIVGLMCIPPLEEDPHFHFSLLRDIASKNNLKSLSMGMSSDYQQGISCGATHIRVGTKLFGKRS
jgi:hypothetical protein